MASAKFDIGPIVSKIVSEVKSKLKKPDWILCSTKLPAENERVLVCTSQGYVGIDKYGKHTLNKGEIKYNGWGCSNANPIAWMPLPEPYKGDVE